MSKIDDVAKAISDNISAGLPDGAQVDYRYAAVAAIEAMKPTTNRMDVAGAIYLRGHISDASGCFEEMIDAALGERKE